MTTTETEAEPEVYPWLPSASVLMWLKLTRAEGGSTGAALATAELCRTAAASWIEDQRPDLATVVDDVRVFAATERIVMAGLLATARLHARKDSPNGVVTFEELGAGSILSTDPDVRRYLGRRRPVIG